jgi:low affinity Fe/Cu permease
MLKEAYESARLKFKSWSNWRNEQAAERRASEPPGVTVPLWLVNAAKFASWVATLSLMYFLWLYTLDIARDRAGAMHITHAGTWVGELEFWFPYIVGFSLVAFGIPYVAKIAIPTFMSLSWRGNFWPKLWALVIAVAVSLVVIAGTFTVQGDTLMERDREAAVAVEQVQTGRAVLEARIAARERELSEMMNNRNAYLAQAASVGAVEWQRSYIDQTPANDPQRDRIVRALGAARSADTVRADIQTLREQLASSTAVAAVQGEVTTERTGWIADTLGWLEGVRAILLSLVMDIVALMMPWIALRLEQARNRQMGLYTDAVSSRWSLIADQSDTTAANRDPQRRAAQDVADAMMAGGADPRFAADMARSAAAAGTSREEMFDAETGERLIYRKGGWVRPPTRKGKAEKITVPPGPIPADERGVSHDGGGRMGSVAGAVKDVNNEAGPEQAERGGAEHRSEYERGNVKRAEEGSGQNEVERSEHHEPEGQPFHDAQPDAAELAEQDLSSELPDLTDDELLAFSEEPEQPQSASESGGVQGEQEEPDHSAIEEVAPNLPEPIEHHEPRTEPETDERRLIAAE